MQSSDADPEPQNATIDLIEIDDQLRAELIEQLMRVTDDDTLLYQIVKASDRAGVLTSIGAVLPHLHMEFLAGSPVLAILGAGALDPAWRRSYPPRPSSLWSELELMRSLSITTPASDPLTELLAARTAAR